MVAVRKLPLGLAVAISLSAGSAKATELNLQPATVPYTAWGAPLTTDKTNAASPFGNVVSLTAAPAATATKTLDLKQLSLSDFGDVDPAR